MARVDLTCACNFYFKVAARICCSIYKGFEYECTVKDSIRLEDNNYNNNNNKTCSMQRLELTCINPLHTGGLFHGYMLDKSICHFMDVSSSYVIFIIFLMENPVSKQYRP